LSLQHEVARVKVETTMPEMCESCNLFEKLYNSFIHKASHLYTVVSKVGCNNDRFIEGIYTLTFKNKKMRAKIFLQIASLILLIAITLPASSASLVPGSSPINSIPGTEDTRTQQLIHRLEDIKGMNKSELTRLEKKSLRKEVKGIKKELKDNGKGVYLSVGAIIIIILLLILIL
jgi:hypothetical protein